MEIIVEDITFGSDQFESKKIFVIELLPMVLVLYLLPFP
jgi:hypothetical protein